MRKVSKKASLKLSATYGINPEIAIPMVTHIDSRVAIDIGWIQLHFGYDEKWSEVLFAVVKDDTFLLAATPPLHSVKPKAQKNPDWVYASDYLPGDFCNGAPPPTVVSYCGFRVQHGVDFDNRTFLNVAMPNGELQLLFRDPASDSAAAWSSTRAVSMADGLVIAPHESAWDLDKLNAESTGDADLDWMLSQLN